MSGNRHTHLAKQRRKGVSANTVLTKAEVKLWGLKVRRDWATLDYTESGTKRSLRSKQESRPEGQQIHYHLFS